MTAHHRRSVGSLAFDSINGAILIVLCVTMLYPLYYVLVASLSDGYRLMAHTGPLAGSAGLQRSRLPAGVQQPHDGSAGS